LITRQPQPGLRIRNGGTYVRWIQTLWIHLLQRKGWKDEKVPDRASYACYC
jgi:hypothetical protein